MLLTLGEHLNMQGGLLHSAGLHPVQPTLSSAPNDPRCRSACLEELPPILQFIRQHADQLVAVGEVTSAVD